MRHPIRATSVASAIRPVAERGASSTIPEVHAEYVRLVAGYVRCERKSAMRRSGGALGRPVFDGVQQCVMSGGRRPRGLLLHQSAPGASDRGSRGPYGVAIEDMPERGISATRKRFPAIFKDPGSLLDPARKS